MKQFLPQATPNSTKVILQTYTAESVKVIGKMVTQIKYGEYEGVFKLYVAGAGPTLMGLNWLHQIHLDWKALGVATVRDKPQTLSEILKEHEEIFWDELGTMKDFKAKLSLKNNAKSKFCCPRQISFALKEFVEQELKQLQEIGILEQVKYSE